MLLRNVATAFNNKKVVTVGRTNGFMGISTNPFSVLLLLLVMLLLLLLLLLLLCFS